jgi:hypothetical protein
MLGNSGPLSREGSLLCHTCCDTEPRFSQPHLKDQLIQLSLMTHKGMWRIYSNPDPHESMTPLKMKKKIYTYVKNYIYIYIYIIYLVVIIQNLHGVIWAMSQLPISARCAKNAYQYQHMCKKCT